MHRIQAAFARPTFLAVIYVHTHHVNVVSYRAVFCALCIVYSGVGGVPRPSEVDESYAGKQNAYAKKKRMKRGSYDTTVSLVLRFCSAG